MSRTNAAVRLAPFCFVLIAAVLDPHDAVEAFACRLLKRRLDNLA